MYIMKTNLHDLMFVNMCLLVLNLTVSTINSNTNLLIPRIHSRCSKRLQLSLTMYLLLNVDMDPKGERRAYVSSHLTN